MVDKLTPEKRSWNMSRIGSRDTKPELFVRSIIHKMGYRFRLHLNALPGKPDIVLKKYSAIVFVHGCFWHRHGRCKMANMPKSRKKFWADKLNGNARRDNLNIEKLIDMGYKVLVVWECEIKVARNDTKMHTKLENKIRYFLNHKENTN